MWSTGRRCGFASRADARIRLAFRHKPINGVAVLIQARCLIERTFILFQTKPTQVFNRLLVSALFDSRTIDVFDAEDDAPAELASEKPIHEERSGISQMQSSCRRRREPRRRCGCKLWHLLPAYYEAFMLAIQTNC